jgi:hypothetical protein
MDQGGGLKRLTGRLVGKAISGEQVRVVNER